ncbi:MAG: hypothetical protein JWN66_3386 [Sphingomonas bacterium]|uniref:glycosyltransferase family 4 protein n=1 Tax=Sphingomonas bacterium TaxID=1895847 RepID=UPI00262BF58E|nr:glycosyltransferase [Sphingomonas bacterium]MDB5706270.1 hypothetical protein [Sphingomonas bacterium]
MADPLSILLIGYAHGEGGVTTHTHWLAHGLTQRGHHVQVLSPVPPRDLPESPWPDRGYAVDHYGGKRDALRGFSALGKTRFDVAVVAGTGWKAMGGVIANRRIRRRVFFEVMSGDSMGLADPRHLVHAGFDAIVSLATTVDEKVCSEFRWRGKRTIIQALPEPLELQATIPDRGIVTPKGKMRGVYFGRIVPHKGVGFLVEQWAALSEHLQSIDIYGTGDQRAELEARIAELGLDDVIRFHGRYPDGQSYVDLLRDFDLLLLPTVGQEGGPLVLLEAMACGTPFVANGVGGIPDFANPDCRVTSGDIAEFLPAVASIADQMAAGQVDGSRLQRHYHANFSYEVLVGRWESYLRFLADGKR